MGNSTLATPATAFPHGPAPTPIRRSRSGVGGLQVAETVPPTPSQYFPKDLSALFALSQGAARRLLRDYGLSSATASPINENPKPRGLPSVDEEPLSDSEKGNEDTEAHAQDMNVFMKHIGVRVTCESSYYYAIDNVSIRFLFWWYLRRRKRWTRRLRYPPRVVGRCLPRWLSSSTLNGAPFLPDQNPLYSFFSIYLMLDISKPLKYPKVEAWRVNVDSSTDNRSHSLLLQMPTSWS